jgi:putative spermidine/putrescine transport system substrate-binding protein
MLPDTPLTIALAALYLKAARPALGITDPYELTGPQFTAATRLLANEASSVTQFEGTDPEVIDALATGHAVLGAVQPRNVDVLARAGVKAASSDPAEGTTGSVDFWLMNANAPDPSCMYQWLSWSLTPRLQQQVAQWSGTSPVNPAACDGLGHRLCALYHAADPAYLSSVAFAHQPGTDCGNGRRDCVGWEQWQHAWMSIARGSPG